MQNRLFKLYYDDNLLKIFKSYCHRNITNQRSDNNEGQKYAVEKARWDEGGNAMHLVLRG